MLPDEYAEMDQGWYEYHIFGDCVVISAEEFECPDDCDPRELWEVEDDPYGHNDA
jgi:hypothetical protein